MPFVNEQHGDVADQADTGQQGGDGTVVVVVPPVTRLASKGGGRTADGKAAFFVGEQDFLYFWIQAQSGTYLVVSFTFQLVQGNFPVVPPNGADDFTAPVSITRYTPSAAQYIEGDYYLNTTNMQPGSYLAKAVITATTSDNDPITLLIEFPVVIS